MIIVINPPLCRMVMEFNSTKNYNQIRKLINVLGQDFSTSKDNNKRKGGLLGLAATSIGLGKDTDKFVEELVSPVLNCLLDPEVRVRLFASESLYNIVKVARGSIIPLFPRIFSALSRLVTGEFTSNFILNTHTLIYFVYSRLGRKL